MSWKITFDFQDGEGFRDITNLVKLKSLERKTQIHNNLKPVVNSCSFKIAWDTTIINLLLTNTSDIMVTIDKNSIPWFTGTVRKNFKGSIKSARREEFKIEVVDLGETFLKKKIGITSALASYKVSDTTNTGASIVHYLLSQAGLSAANMQPNDILTTIDYFINIRDESTYWSKIEKILFEMGYVFYFDFSGNFRTYDLFPSSLVTPNELNSSGNMVGSLVINKKPEQFEGVDIKWWGHELLTNIPVFNDTTGGDSSNSCNINVDPSGYYPTGASDHPVYSEYKVNDREIIIALNTDFATGVSMEAGLTLITATDYFKRARLEAYNSAVSIKKITSFKIMGNAIVKGDLTITKVLNVIDTDKKKSFETEYITDAATALRLVSGLAQFYKYSDFLYSCKSQTEYEPGDIVQIIDSISSIDLTTRVISRKDFGHISDIVYTLEGVAEYAAQTTEEEGVHSQPPALPPGANAGITEGLPTYLELDEGYISPSGGTTVPTIPTLLCDSAYKSIILRLDKQINLRWLKEYQMQVSSDGSNWYALRLDGVDWKGALGQTTAWPAEMLVHSRIPSNLTDPEDPQPRSLFYRVRRVTVQEVASDWSATITGSTSLLETGDIPANTISANMVNTSFLQAVFVNISGDLVIGFTGTGTPSAPNEGDSRYYINGIKSAIEEFTGGNWSAVNGVKMGGLDSNGNVAPFITCRGIINPLAEEIQNGEFLPEGNTRAFNFENAVTDQNGADPWKTKRNVAFSGTIKKFGDYALTNNDGTNIAALVASSGVWTPGESVGMGAWIYITQNNPLYELEFFKWEGYNTKIALRFKEDEFNVFIRRDNSSGSIYSAGHIAMPKYVWQYIWLWYNKKTNKITYGLNGTEVHSFEGPAGTWPPPSEFFTLIHSDPLHGWNIIVDDLVIFEGEQVSSDIFIQHYNHNVSWNTDASVKDIVLKPAPGGKVRAIGGLVNDTVVVTGPVGSQGIQGEQGLQGIQGEQGIQGDAGIGNVWNSLTTYTLNAVVTFGDTIYKSLQTNNTNNQPHISTMFWELAYITNSSSYKIMHLQHRLSPSVASGSVVVGWNTCPTNYTAYNTIPNASLNTLTYEFTLPAGLYEFYGMRNVFYVNGNASKLTNVTNGTTQLVGQKGYADQGDGYNNDNVVTTGIIDINTESTFKLELYAETARGDTGWGFTTNSYGGEDSVWEDIIITDLNSLKGEKGDTGSGFDTWNNIASYGVNSIVADDGIGYISLQTNNIGKKPINNSAWWKPAVQPASENIFPIGSTYLQFPGYSDPNALGMPGVWSNVSSSSAGRFLRVEGAVEAGIAAADFGSGQNHATQRFIGEATMNASQHGFFTASAAISGLIRKGAATTDSIGGSSTNGYKLRLDSAYASPAAGTYRYNNYESRPVNNTIRIWGRIS